MTVPEENPQNIQQSIHADDSGVAFVQGSGTQHNNVTQNYFGSGGLPTTPENLYRQGEMKLQALEWDEAHLFLTAAAEAGHVEAMQRLSGFPSMGGAFWTQKLAEIGDADALYSLGMTARAKRDGNYPRERAMYREEALKWFEKALQAGREDALVDIGYLLYEAERYEEAIPYLEKALQYLERTGENDEQFLARRLKSSRKKVARQREREAKMLRSDTGRRWWQTSKSD
ncbi:hypothetical protein [Streptomyces pseudogriseolus]|uniref:hypothetical protein n=1 Tax=Streptomyces pseudogriseolus TaxID=36817 RepID=UPI003FA277B3